MDGNIFTIYSQYILNVLTFIENLTVPELVIPSPWDDSTAENDSSMIDFLDYVNSLGQEDDEEEVETPDPTTIPVCNILEMYLQYIANIFAD